MHSATLSTSAPQALSISPEDVADTLSTISDTSGPRPWECLSLSEFFDYRTGPFTRRVYCGAGWLVVVDLGRTLGLVAEAWTPARVAR